MLDADLAANAAGQLARFAERVRDADRPAVGSSADRARRLFTRAALVRQWPDVRERFNVASPTSDAALSEGGRQLAELCRTSRKDGWIGGWPKEANDLLARAADRLTLLADRLDAMHKPAGLAAQLARVFDHWQRTDPLTARLVGLEGNIQSRLDFATGLLDELSDTPLGHVAAKFDARLSPADGWTPDARAVAVVVCQLLDRLTARTAHLALWEHTSAWWQLIAGWANGWFEAGGGRGKVLLEDGELTGVVTESFPVQEGRRVVLAVVPPGGGVETPDAEPSVGADGSRFDWPLAASRSSDEPFDTILEVRSDGRVTLSDGPLSAAFARFHDLYTLTADDPRWWAGERWRKARMVCRTPDPAAVAAVATAWIDECSPTPAQFAGIRTWAEAGGLMVTPADSPDTPGVTVRHVFASAPSGTPVGGNRAGFSFADEVFRPAVVDVSAGPLPAGFAELEQAGRRLPRGGELEKLVSKLRTAAEGDYLREAVLGLYSDFWGEAGNAARETDPDATSEVGERLNTMLADAYGLRPFSPANVHDLPSGWISVAPGSRVLTGMVTRVLRPGLQDDHGHLRIPAVVEVE